MGIYGVCVGGVPFNSQQRNKVGKAVPILKSVNMSLNAWHYTKIRLLHFILEKTTVLRIFQISCYSTQTTPIR